MKKYLDFAASIVSEASTSLNGNVASPPAQIVFRRKLIRNFGDKKVALYYADSINKYVTIPYDGDFNKKNGQNILQVTEDVIEEKAPVKKEEETPNDAFSKLGEVIKHKKRTRITFEDGSAVVIDAPTAQTILNTHGALNSQNRDEMVKRINKSKHTFLHVKSFSDGIHAGAVLGQKNSKGKK